MVYRKLRWLVMTALLSTLVPGVLLADGTVSGLVLDARSGQPVRGAVVQIGEDGPELTTDLNGVFQGTVTDGPLELIVSAEGYRSQRLLDIVIEPGGLANVSAVLEPLAGTSAADGEDANSISEEITVQAAAIEASEQALLAERKASARIVDNIGSEEISKNAGSTAAGALKRVTGISVQDNKFVYVRGLGERYSNTQLNGSKMPSTEFERKVVPLDLFSSGLLEKITVSKSYSADQPGDFAAGVVSLETKQFPARQQFSVGVSLANDSNATGDDVLNYPGGLSTSGSGGQALPGGFPDARVRPFNIFTQVGYTPDELAEIGRSVAGPWAPRRESAAPNSGLNMTYGNSFDRLGVVASASWGRSFDRREEERNFYVFSLGQPERESFFDIDYGNEQVRTSLMANLAYRLGDNSQLRFRGLATDLARTEGRQQSGFFAAATNTIENFRVQYRAQEVRNLQLSADHFFSKVGSGGALLEWRTAAGDAQTEENLRETLYTQDGDTFILEPQGQSGFLFFNELDDELSDSRVDWTTFLTGDESFGSIKAGLAYTENDRQFGGRRFLFVGRPDGPDYTASPDEIYGLGNIGPTGWTLREATVPNDNYTGTQEIAGAYVQGDWSRKKWRLIGGLRYEDSEQEVVSFDPNRPGALSEPPASRADQDFLPALSAVYSLSDRMSLRGSLSRTVNRPEFREIAAFAFNALIGGFTVFGNPDLQQAAIDSADVRWEWYPSASEIVAFSLFYKSFDSPIEQVAVPGSIPSLTFANAGGAENRGFEVEVRRSFGSVSDKLSAFTGMLNYTFVDSEVQLDDATTDFTNLDRPLAGQPDNIVNLVLEWTPRDLWKWPTTVRLLYNFKDDNILFGGRRGLQDVVEESRDTLDLVWQQQLPGGLALKLSGTNLTDTVRDWTQGGEIWRSFREGRQIGLSVNYSFR